MDSARLSRTIVGFPDPLLAAHKVRVVNFAVMEMGHGSHDFVAKGIRSICKQKAQFFTQENLFD